jgi:hypothetical protein
MEEELLIETPPTPGPFFRFADENAWLTAARAAGFTADFPVYVRKAMKLVLKKRLSSIPTTTPLMLSALSPLVVSGMKRVMKLWHLPLLTVSTLTTLENCLRGGKLLK